MIVHALWIFEHNILPSFDCLRMTNSIDDFVWEHKNFTEFVEIVCRAGFLNVQTLLGHFRSPRPALDAGPHAGKIT